MSKHVVLDGFLDIDANDISAFIQSCTLEFEVDAVDSTTWGEDERSFVAGLGTGTLSITFAQDYDAATGIEAIMSALRGQQAAFTARPFPGAVAANNPQYAGVCLVTKEVFMDATQGELNTASVSFPAFSATRTIA